MAFISDLAYLQLLNTNQELRKELGNEITINKTNEKKIRNLIKEVEECYKTISFQDNTIIANESEIQELKFQVSNLEKRLRKALKDNKKKEAYISNLEQHLNELQEEVYNLKKRIQELSLHRYISKDSNMMQTNRNAIAHSFHCNTIYRETNNIRIYIQNPNLSTLRPDDILEKLNSISSATNRIEEIIEASKQQNTETITTLKKQVEIAEGEQELLSKAYRNEVKERRHWWFSYRNKHRNVIALQQEKFAYIFICKYLRQKLDLTPSRGVNLLRRINQLENLLQTSQENNKSLQQDLNTCQNDLFLADIQLDIKWGKWKRKEKISHQIILNQNQNIFNLQQQILNLQNIQNPNMATIADVMKTIAPRLATLQDYDGQEPPDTYYAKLRAINETARPLAVAGFNALERTNIMKSKMTGKFFPVPLNDQYTVGNPAINTEQGFYNWLKGKYREVMIGNQRASLKALMNEKFNSIDSIDTYEKRVKPLTLGIANEEVLPYLFDHLPPRIETRMRIANPNTIDDFFIQLRIIWLEMGGHTSNFNRDMEINNFPQKNDALEKFADIAQRLGYIGNLSDPIAIHKFVEDDLTRKLGVHSNHIKKVYNTKKPLKVTYKCSRCGKIGHRKNKCPKMTKTTKKNPKKVNYTFQSESEDYDQEDECVEVIEDEIEDDDDEMIEDEESSSDDEPQNCFNTKKKVEFQ